MKEVEVICTILSEKVWEKQESTPITTEKYMVSGITNDMINQNK